MSAWRRGLALHTLLATIQSASTSDAIRAAYQGEVAWGRSGPYGSPGGGGGGTGGSR